MLDQADPSGLSLGTIQAKGRGDNGRREYCEAAPVTVERVISGLHCISPAFTDSHCLRPVSVWKRTITCWPSIHHRSRLSSSCFRASCRCFDVNTEMPRYCFASETGRGDAPPPPPLSCLCVVYGTGKDSIKIVSFSQTYNRFSDFVHRPDSKEL
jgi:hypothetical protein